MRSLSSLATVSAMSTLLAPSRTNFHNVHRTQHTHYLMDTQGHMDRRLRRGTVFHPRRQTRLRTRHHHHICLGSLRTCTITSQASMSMLSTKKRWSAITGWWSMVMCIRHVHHRLHPTSTQALSPMLPDRPHMCSHMASNPMARLRMVTSHNTVLRPS